MHRVDGVLLAFLYRLTLPRRVLRVRALVCLFQSRLSRGPRKIQDETELVKQGILMQQIYSSIRHPPSSNHQSCPTS